MNLAINGNNTDISNILSPNPVNASSTNVDTTAFRQLLESSESGPVANDEFKDTFRKFVGNTMYGQMLKSMRSTIGKPAYMHGGRTEEVFQQQLDQILVDDLTERSADTVADPMFELFNLNRGR